MTITEHLIDGAEHVPSLRHGGNITPKYILIHGTYSSIEQCIWDFTDNPFVKESTHLLVAEDGSLTQFLPLNSKAWHAGASHWQGHYGMNNFSIGVHVQLSHNGSLGPTAFKALDTLLPEMVAEYSIRDIINIPRPGAPAVDILPFKVYVDYGNADSLGRFLATSDADVRMGPGVSFKKLYELLNGDTIKVLRYSPDGEWAFISFERKAGERKQGWTHESFLRRL